MSAPAAAPGRVLTFWGENLEAIVNSLATAHGLKACGRAPVWLHVNVDDPIHQIAFHRPTPFETARLRGLAWSAELDDRIAAAQAAGRDVVLHLPAAWSETATLLERADLLMITVPSRWWAAQMAFSMMRKAMAHVAEVGWARTRCRPWLLPTAWPSGPAHVQEVRDALAGRFGPGSWGRLPPAAVLPWCAPALPPAAFLELLGHPCEEPDPRLAAAAPLLARAALTLVARPDAVFATPEDMFGEGWSPPQALVSAAPAAWTIEGAIRGHPQWADGARVRLTVALEAIEDDADA